MVQPQELDLLPLLSLRCFSRWHLLLPRGKEGGERHRVPHLVEDSGIAGCCRNPHLLEEFVTDGILMFRTEIGATKDNPEKTKRLLLMQAEAPGTPPLEKCRGGKVSLGLAKPCMLPAPSCSHSLQ